MTIIFSLSNLLSLGILFFLVFLSSLGFPGGIVSLAAAGALAGSFEQLILVMIAGILGAILGDVLAYEAARKFSRFVSSGLKKFMFSTDKESGIERKIAKSEFSIIFFSRFLFTALCAPVSYISGLLSVKRKKFLIPVVSGEILYGAIYPILGFSFKSTWNDLTNVVADIVTGITLIIIIAIIIRVLYLKRNKRKNAKNI